MKSIVSPMNVVALLITVIAIIGFAISSRKADNLQYLWLFPTLLLPIFLVFLNFLFQHFISNPIWFNRVEIATLLIVALILYFVFRTPQSYTAQLPDGFGRSFIAIIYDVENAPKLFEDSKQLFPKNGILYSAGKKTRTHSLMEIKGLMQSGEVVNGFLSRTGELNCADKIHPYTFWYFGSNKKDWAHVAIDTIDLKVKTLLNEQCESLKNIRR